MADRSAYSAIGDLLVGDIAMPDTIKQRHVLRASDEIDSRLGFLYTVPFTESNTSHAGWLLIQRLNTFIASGRLLMEITQSGELDRVHAYGKSLLEDADATIKAILDGAVNLGPDDPDNPANQTKNRPKAVSVDPYSQVEAFYAWASQPPSVDWERYPVLNQPRGWWTP